jgi:predicted transposase YdaD
VPTSSTALRQEVADTDQALPLADVITAIVISRFNCRLLKELCAMGGITLDDLSQGVVYQEIYGQGRQEVPIRALPLERLAAAAG